MGREEDARTHVGCTTCGRMRVEAQERLRMESQGRGFTEQERPARGEEGPARSWEA